MMIDWDETSREERKLLAGPARKLKNRLGMTWPKVFAEAFGPRDRVGERYEDNLSKGRIAPAKAHKLFLWINKHDPSLTNDLEDSIFKLRRESIPEQAKTWAQLLARGSFSNVRLFKHQTGLSINRLARREPIHTLKLKLFEEFYFELDVPFVGTLTAFVGYRDQWYPQIIADGSNTLAIKKGTQILPANADGSPDPLWEEDHDGKHSYAFLVGEKVDLEPCPTTGSMTPQPIPKKTLDRHAYQIFRSTGRWTLFRMNVLFVR